MASAPLAADAAGAPAIDAPPLLAASPVVSGVEPAAHAASTRAQGSASAAGSEPVVNINAANPAALQPAQNASFPPLPMEPAGAARASAPVNGVNVDRSADAASSVRAAHTAGTAQAVSSTAQAVTVSPVAAQAASPALAQNAAAALPQQSTALPTAPAAPSLAREPFAALDSGATPGVAAANTAADSAAWTRTGAHSVEAGFEDPSLGWVGVRADLAAGQVHATVVPGSAEAAQALGGQLAGLHAYLNDQRTPVGSLALAAPEGGASAGGNSGLAGNPQNQHPGDPPPAPALPSSIAAAGERSAAAAQPGQPEILVPLYEHAGAYISVLA